MHICIYTYIYVSPIFVWEDLNGSLWMGGRGGGFTYENLTPQTNLSCHMWKSIAMCERVVSHTNESMFLCPCSFICDMTLSISVCLYPCVRVMTHSYVPWLLYEWTHSNVTWLCLVIHTSNYSFVCDMTLIRINSFERDTFGRNSSWGDMDSFRRDSYTNELIRTWHDSAMSSVRVITHLYVTWVLYIRTWLIRTWLWYK